MSHLFPDEQIINHILYIRGEKVMLDRDLARLYGVKTKVLKQSVRRNIDRFPEDFMFELTNEEFKNWRSRFVTSNSSENMGLRYKPYTFTEHGILMLANVVKSEKAIHMSSNIIKIFNRMRKLALSHKNILKKLDAIEEQVLSNTEGIQELWFELKKILYTEDEEGETIGFKMD